MTGKRRLLDERKLVTRGGDTESCSRRRGGKEKRGEGSVRIDSADSLIIYYRQ
jgi:hypothetical protein